MESALSVRVLGSVQVTLGVPHELASRRQRSLLAALVLREGRPVSVSELVDAVWDDEPPANARTTLQTYVSRLRNLLGPDTILHSPAGYQLGERVVTDLRSVRTSVGELSKLEQDDPRRLELALRALGHWKGQALAEFEDNTWFRGHRVELNETRANLIDIAAHDMIRTDQCAQAVAILEASLVDEPLREPTQVLLIQALVRAGRRTEAVRTASQYRRALRDETGLVPGAAFNQAEQLALSDGPESSVVAPELRERPAASWRSADLGRPTPLVGRLSEIDQIETALRTARLVSIVGIGGVGKSRLAAELIARWSRT
jgi:DNA-binding SARP family transcriptional activator